MEYTQFHNCLRLQITPDDMYEERIDDLVRHCLENGFDNVMLMLNLEEFNIGHITIEKAEPWVRILKQAKSRLEDKGIVVSVNNWLELGHADRGIPFYQGQDFLTMTDMYGRNSTFVVCPMGEKWQEYFVEYVKYLVKELSPDTFWIEDDFRLHNHLPLKGIGCFCEKHMAYYNAKLKKHYTREEFVNKITEPGKCNDERKVFLDANRDVILSLAERIVKAVKEANPNTDVALMSSAASSHCLEGRDWDKLFRTLGAGGKKIHRIHLSYGEMSGKDMLYYFNQNSMAVRAMTDDDVLVMPEIEHSSASKYSRTPRYLRFAMEAAIPLGLSGMTYSIYDFVGNGVRDSLGYGRVVKELRPFMQAAEDLQLRFSQMEGVIVPIDPRASYYRSIKNKGQYGELEPREYHIAAYLSGLGITYTYSREKAFSGKMVFLCGSSIDYFDDEQLKKLFEDNYILLDGSGALALNERGLLHLIGGKSVRRVEPNTGYYTYEECADENLVIAGVRKHRASGRATAGSFAEIEYQDGVHEMTEVKNAFMQRVAAGFTKGANHAVLPFCITGKHMAQFCDLRRYCIVSTVKKHAPEYAVCGIEGVSPYLYKQESRAVLVLSNGNLESYDEIPLALGGVTFEKISRLDKNGQVYPVDFEREDEKVLVKTPMEYMSATVLIFH